MVVILPFTFKQNGSLCKMLISLFVCVCVFLLLPFCTQNHTKTIHTKQTLQFIMKTLHLLNFDVRAVHDVIERLESALFYDTVYFAPIEKLIATWHDQERLFAVSVSSAILLNIARWLNKKEKQSEKEQNDHAKNTTTTTATKFVHCLWNFNQKYCFAASNTATDENNVLIVLFNISLKFLIFFSPLDFFRCSINFKCTVIVFIATEKKKKNGVFHAFSTYFFTAVELICHQVDDEKKKNNEEIQKHIQNTIHFHLQR